MKKSSGSFVGISNFDGTIATGKGNDNITGSGDFYGILNFDGTIETGKGNDNITGNASDEFGRGIGNNSTIATGNGKDNITGSGNRIGIENSGTIETGNGRDTVDALTGGFAGNGMINLGKGKDLIRGFGEQTVDGGRGFDTAELGIDFDQTLLSLGSSPYIDIEIGEMSFANVEKFVFSDERFTLHELQDLV